MATLSDQGELFDLACEALDEVAAATDGDWNAIKSVLDHYLPQLRGRYHENLIDYADDVRGENLE